MGHCFRRGDRLASVRRRRRRDALGRHCKAIPVARPAVSDDDTTHSRLPGVRGQPNK